MMKKAEVKVGSYYIAKVSGRLTCVKITAAPMSGGWIGTNMRTGSTVRIRGARRLRSEVTDFATWFNQNVKALITKKFGDGPLPFVDEKIGW